MVPVFTFALTSLQLHRNASASCAVLMHQKKPDVSVVWFDPSFLELFHLARLLFLKEFFPYAALFCLALPLGISLFIITSFAFDLTKNEFAVIGYVKLSVGREFRLF